ncbi:beta-ketoacyl synthase N-terminal-like domain-containing protein [Dyella silvatica]|uniref:beta-ketoacyl synthase N-terminal-like domain-containing protein n=1 Tax=Dyella silvatica TaxID=2992128 RepID=UPI00225B7C73|nr:beta-ketoacyl synthase N-terminal-like domain-containing protein [Dyella silvatica]
MLPLDIVGIGCLLPDAETLQAFWRNLDQGKRSIRQADAADWGVDPRRFLASGGQADRTPSIEIAKPRHYRFDPQGYRLPATFLAEQDRCLQWPLAVARHALSDAGLWPDTNGRLNRIGLLLGSYAWAVGAATDAQTRPLYEQAVAAAFATACPEASLQLAPGRAMPGTHPQSARIGGGLTSTIARALGLGGPRYSLDAACATSLYALRLAASHIAAGEADAMLVVAASAFDSLYANLGFAATQALPDGSLSRPFDARSAGLAPGEGAIAMLVRRAETGAASYGVIRAIGLSSDGRGQTLTAPSAKGQRLACERAYRDAGITPASVAYVECHATGTQMGDRVELETMSQVFGPGQPVGSVKSNLGHLLTAAGAAGLLKIVLAMREGSIPATVGIEQPLSGLDGDGADIVCSKRHWPDGLRRAAVNAFGFGGVNAHLIVDAPGVDVAGADMPLATPSAPSEPALVTGMAATIGDCADLHAVAHALQQAQPRLREMPASRHAGLPFAAPRGAYLDRVAIDALRLRLPPNDLERLHPQQPLMLAVGDAALRDAGIAAGSRTAVIIAASMDHGVHRLLARWESGWRLADALDAAGLPLSEAQRQQLAQAVADALHQPADAAVALGYIGNLLASRIAALWDFSGPAFTLSGDETTALRALDVGARLLAEGEADAVLVGAIDLAGAIENLLIRRLNGEESGAALAEGACAVVLEPAAAVAARQARGYAQWRGAGFADKLGEAAEQARQHAGLNAEELIELLDIGALGADGGSKPLALRGCPALASSAAVFGHSRMLAPLLGVVHMALALSARMLPAWAGWSETQQGALSEGEAYVPAEATPWFRRHGGRRLAAVYAADRDGSVAQACLGEAPQGLSRAVPEPALPLLLAITADHRDALLERLRASITEPAELAARCQRAMRDYDANAPLALVLLAEDAAALLEEIRAALAQIPTAQDWQSPRGSRFTAQPLGREGAVALVYSPLNTAFSGLARGVTSLLPSAMDALDQNYRDVGETIGAALLYPRQLAPLDAESRMQVEHDKAAVRESWQLAEGEAVDWVNYLLLAPAAEVLAAAAGEARAYVSLINSPDEVTLVGERAACARVLSRLGINAIAAPDSLVVHCAPAALERERIATVCTPQQVGAAPPGLLFAGGAPAQWTPQAIAERVASDLVSPLDFNALTEQAYALGARLFLEMGPGANASRWIGKTLKGRPHACFAMSRRDHDDRLGFAKLVALLVAHRVPLQLASVWRLPDEPSKAPALFKDLHFGQPPLVDGLVASLRKQGLDRVLQQAAQARRFEQATPVAPVQAVVAPLSADSSVPAIPASTASLPPLNDAALGIAARHAQAHRAYLDLHRQSLRALLGQPSLNPAAAVAEHQHATSIARPPTAALYDESAVMEFAEGRVSHVFGPAYAAADRMPRRLRLPGPPFLALSRVTQLSGTHGQLHGSHIRTEFDIPNPAWNAVDGQTVYLALDAQGVLFLASWLGIDAQNQGRRAYRWLDATLTFLGNTPLAGECVEYDINIVESFRNGDALLFKTEFLARTRDRPLLKIERCTAGFFTYEELATGAGIGPQHMSRRQPAAAPFVPPLQPPSRPLETADLVALAAGDIAQVLSPAHACGGRNPSLRMPPTIMHMIERIAYIHSTGGVCGLGRSAAEFRLDPLHWAIRAHFKDDPVFPGPCMLEGAFQLLQAHALALGLASGLRDARFQPVIERPVEVRFRAQVLPRNQLFGYRAEIIAIGLSPEPYLIADIDLLDEGRVAGRIEGLGVRLVGTPITAPALATHAQTQGALA